MTKGNGASARPKRVAVDNDDTRAMRESLEKSAALLRSLTPRERAATIIAIHSWAVSEFAKMVLEHTRPERRRRRR